MKVNRLFIFFFLMVQFTTSLDFTEYNDYLKRKNDRKYVLSLIIKKYDETFDRICEILKDEEFLKNKDVLIEKVNLENSQGFPDLFFSN